VAIQVRRHGSFRCAAAEDAEELEGREKAPAGRFPRTTLAEQMMDVATLKEMLGMEAGERHAFE